MLGVSRTVREGRPNAHEFLRIHEENGALILTAHPSGQSAASFRSEEMGEHRIAFVNPDHDFPQKIEYELKDSGSLTGRISGEQNGKKREATFPYKPADCP